MKKMCLMWILILTAGTVWSQSEWNAPDRNRKLAAEIPGIHFSKMLPAQLLKNASEEAMRKWTGPMEEAYFAGLAKCSPSDDSVNERFPRTISPFARIRGVKIDPKVYSAASLKGNQWKSLRGLFTYCPFCGSEVCRIVFDPKNPDKAVTECCKTELYRDHYPRDYKLKPNFFAEFRYLDDSIRRVPCTLYKDKFGNEWELFIQNLFNNKYWLDIAGELVRYQKLYQKTGNPLYPYKAALILDHASDTYYALPLTFSNLMQPGKDGRGLSRAEWEAAPRPIVFEHSYLGPWNRRNPFSAGDKGWLNMHKEAIWAEPFALMRHHPAFRYYSKKKYGKEDALEKKVISKLLREVSLAYKACFSQRLMSNYQEANYKDLLMIGILTEDPYLIDFAGANQELTLYNHHYHDGMNGEGAQNYMAMLSSYYYPYMKSADGFSKLYPDFLKDNPFFKTASTEWRSLHTVRGIPLEFGDQHQYVALAHRLNTSDHVVSENEKLPSRNWPGYGVGLLRAGGPGERLEVSLHYSRATLHNAQDMLGISCWFDGIPVVRTGGYASDWGNILPGEMNELNAEMNFPRKLIPSPRSDSWSWLLAHSAENQNTVTVDSMGPGPGWNENRGTSELIAFKGGEAYNTPESEFQVLEARSIGEFKYMDINVNVFRRALLAVGTPSGRAYAVDILTLHGGSTQALYLSAWGNRDERNSSLKTVAEYPTLADAWFGGKLPYADPDKKGKVFCWWWNRNLNVYKYIVDAVKNKSGDSPWQVQWDTDYYAYFRDANGKDSAPRMPGSTLGKVKMCLTGVPLDSKTELWSGKCAWSPRIYNQALSKNRRIGSVTVTFEKGFDLVIRKRTSPYGAKLKSRFVSIFEGFHPDARPVVRSADRIQSDENSTALEIVLEDGSKDVLIYQMESRPVRLKNGMETDARYALVRKDKTGRIMAAYMVGGTALSENGKLLLSGKKEYKGKIVDICGDITGNKQESGIIVNPEGVWDLNGLKGRPMLIRVTRANGGITLNEAYTIKNAVALPNGHIRVDFENHAPFIAGWHQVTCLDATKPNRIRTCRPILAFSNQPWYEGTRILFPTRNKTYVVKDTEWQGGGFGGSFLDVEDGKNLAADGIRQGDWFILYAIEPGQEVSVSDSEYKIFHSYPVNQHRKESKKMKSLTLSAIMLTSAALYGQTEHLVADWNFTKGFYNSTDQKFEMTPRTTTRLADDQQTGKYLSVGQFDNDKPQGIISRKVYPELSPAYFKVEAKFRLRKKTSPKKDQYLFDNKYVPYIHPKNRPKYNKGFCLFLTRTKAGLYCPVLWLGYGEKSEGFYGNPVPLKEGEVHTLSAVYNPENEVIFAVDNQINKRDKVKIGGPIAKAFYATAIGDRYGSGYNPFDGDILEVKLYSLEKNGKKMEKKE